MTTLAMALAATIKHDGHGGVADLLSTESDAAAWLTTNAELIDRSLGKKWVAGDDLFPSERVLLELVRMRRAVRALFARAVAPEPPSKADANRLLPVDEALRIVNRAADRLGPEHLAWPDDAADPVVRRTPRTEDPVVLLIGAIGRSTIEFLTSPDRRRLRACPAARCVKYFLQDDPRQQWCSPKCGNRERVNRHYRRHTAG
ncbi:CGNR zinc finger domain-containing protein [Kribbella sp. NPDC048915]|uniref:CGNR zinc finger domain-containing protein n=1 Tax=Kribbella sp. NPDC048915 TaxID=3155148 RepID=UPI0033F981D3